MRTSTSATVLAATLWLSAGCGTNALPGRDAGGTGGFGTGGVYGYGGFPGTGGIVGDGGSGTGGVVGYGGSGTGGSPGIFDASVDAVAGLACPALTEATSSPPPAPPQPGCPCTRRPGQGNSYLCPMGVGQTAYAYIGSDGGSIDLLGQQGAKSNVPFGLTIPPGTLDAETLISVTETDLTPPSGFLDWSPVYLVEPRGLSLHKVAGLQIPWSSNATSSTLSTLTIYARDENGSCGWKPLVDSSTNAGFDQASLTAFGYLFVGMPSTIDPSTCGIDAGARD
jgi:hypothetical protein